jgi:hypothetical protein
MKNELVALLTAGLLGLAASCSKNPEGDPGGFGQLEKGRVQGASEAPATDQAAQTRKKPEPAGATATVDCRLARVEVKPASEGAQPGQETVERELGALLESHFPIGSSPTTHSLSLVVQYAGRRSSSPQGTFFFGASGLLKEMGSVRPLVLRTEVQQDWPLPEECATMPAPDSCAGMLAAGAVRPALDSLLGKLAFDCQVHTGGIEVLRTALQAPDQWRKREAVRMVGERGMTELAPQVLELLDTADEPLCLAVIGALGRLKAEAAVPALVQASGKASEVVVHAVAVALRDIQTPTALRYLEEWARYHPVTSVRSLAEELLKQK